MREADFTRIHDAVARQEPGTFHLSEIYGPDWTSLTIGERVRLGNEFLQAVRAGTFGGVEDTGRKAGGGRVYMKRGAR